MSNSSRHVLMVSCSLAVLFVGLPQAMGAAEPVLVKVVPCARTVEAIAVDGAFSELAWGSSPMVGTFGAFDGSGPAPEQTFLRTLYSDRFLYLGFLCDRPGMAELATTPVKRDAPDITRGECIKVLVRPYHGPLFQIAVNPAGSILDARGADLKWNGGVVAATVVRQDGWWLELAVPWVALGVTPRPGVGMAFNVVRVQQRDRKSLITAWARPRPPGGTPGGEMVLSPSANAVIAAAQRAGVVLHCLGTSNLCDQVLQAANGPRPRAWRAARPRVRKGLVALYTFREGEGTKIRDVSGNDPPLNLKIQDPQTVTWGTDRLRVVSPALITSEGPAKRLREACQATNELTIEAWVQPANDTQGGPSRIVSFSADPYHRNFTLGQQQRAYVTRLRTTTTSDNGLPPLETPPTDPNTGPSHVVYTRDAHGVARLYVNGAEKARGEVSGDFSNWDDSFALCLANELTGDRPWLGDLRVVALYNRALEQSEVEANYAAGPEARVPPIPLAPSAPGPNLKAMGPLRASRALHTDGLLALYAFDRRVHVRVTDRSDNPAPLNLEPVGIPRPTWVPGALLITQPALLATRGPATRICQACQESNEVSVEAWLDPADAIQAGPARIVTLSADPSRRNLTLAQEGAAYIVRLRTTKTSANGTPPLEARDTVVTGRPCHVVYTRDASGQAAIYVNGVEAASGQIPGDFSNWDPSFALGLANEMTLDRPWSGKLHRVSLYQRALSADEVAAHYRLGLCEAILISQQ